MKEDKCKKTQEENREKMGKGEDSKREEWLKREKINCRKLKEEQN
jgi:gluconate kinase